VVSRRWFVLVLAIACSSSAPKPVEQEHPVEPRLVPRDAEIATGDAAVSTGDVQVRVEWHDVPAVARIAPARTPCGNAAAAAVAPTTTWGVPDVFVAIDAAGAPPSATSRVTIERCAAAPRVVVAGAELEVDTTAATPSTVALARRGDLADPSALHAGTARAIQLPIAGHAVTIALERGGLYELTGVGVEAAWIAAASQPFVAVTESNGQVVLRDVPTGHHAVIAWLPPRAGQPARLARGDVAVTAGALAEVTVDLTR
jgi:hypothetical protein